MWTQMEQQQAQTTDAFIPEIWAARFTGRLREQLVWGSRVNRNYEGDIAQAGDTVKIPTPSTTVTIRDYTVGTNIVAAETTTGSTQDLSIDKQKYFHFKVDDVDRAQERPDIMADAMDEASYQMAVQVDSDIRAEFNTAYASTRRIVASNVHPGVTDATFGTAFLRALTAAKRTMTRANLPPGDRWAIVPPEIMEGLENYFVSNNVANVWLPATQEATLMNGFAGTLLGFQLQVANSVPDGAQIASKDTYRIFLGQGNEAVSHAEQIVENEAYRPELAFADAVKGLMVYGTQAVLPERLYTIEVQKAA